MSLRDPASLSQNPMFRHGSLAPRFLLAVSLGAVLASSANAGVIIYETTMTASGTIGATAFTGKTFDIRMTGDTANVTVYSGSFYQNTFNHAGDGISFTISGAGAGGSDITGNITSGMKVISTGSRYYFDGVYAPGAFGYADLWRCDTGAALTSQQALTTVALDYPAATTYVMAQWSSIPTVVTTTAGNLTLNTVNAGTAHFSTGSAAVPEPSQYAMLAGLGLVGFGVWRKKTKSSK